MEIEVAISTNYRSVSMPSSRALFLMGRGNKFEELEVIIMESN
jgi:hypothetical protein